MPEREKVCPCVIGAQDLVNCKCGRNHSLGAGKRVSRPCIFKRRKTKLRLDPVSSDNLLSPNLFAASLVMMADYVGSSETPLQWVNHDAKNMKAAPNRGHVFKHIQTSYRKWKRQEDNKSLAASVKISGATLSAVVASDGPPVRGNRRGRNALPSRLSSKSCSDCSDLVIQRPPSPVTILQRGSSDPFSALSVEITPQMNAMLSFYRDNILRALCRVDTTTGLGSDIADKTWQTQVESLKDPGNRLVDH